MPKNINGVAAWHPGLMPGICLDSSLRENPVLHKCVMAHEIGHIITADGNAIPRISTSYHHRCVATKVEHCGKAWTARYLLPYRELREVMLSGCCEVWELQEHFEVTKEVVWGRLNMADGLNLKNEFMRKQKELIKYG